MMRPCPGLLVSVLTLSSAAQADVLTRLEVGQVLKQGDLLVSPYQKAFATLQSDCNFVLYEGSSLQTRTRQNWASNISQMASCFVTLQADGNLVAFAGTPAAKGGVLWSHNIPNTRGSGIPWAAQVSDIGVLAVFDGRGPMGIADLWNTYWGLPPVAANDVLYIQSSQGGQLSAQQGESLSISPNTNTWEQWTWISEKKVLSYHGTTLLIETGGPRVNQASHAPLYESGSENIPTIYATRSDGTLDTGRPPRYGESVAILFWYYGNYQRLVRSGTGVTLHACDWATCLKTPLATEERWFLSRVPAGSVLSGRSAERKTLVGGCTAEPTHALKVKSPATGAFVIPGAYQYSFLVLGAIPETGTVHWQTCDANGIARYAATPLAWHTFTRTNNFFDLVDSGQVDASTGLRKAVFSGPSAIPADKSIIPAEEPFRAGDRVPQGAKVFIKYNPTGKYLSRAPATWVVWSPNAGANETWVLEQ